MQVKEHEHQFYVQRTAYLPSTNGFPIFANAIQVFTSAVPEFSSPEITTNSCRYES